MRAAAKLREEIAAFEQVTAPAFDQWLQSIFGALLKSEQEAEARIAELEDIITEVTSAQFWSGGTPQTAYKKVMQDRAKQERKAGKDGEDAADDSEEEDLGDPAADEDFGQEERMFRQFVRGVLGMNPDHLSKSEYRTLFREFRHRNKSSEEYSTTASEPKRDHPSRVKELYRLLVRRLHPDSGADYDGESARLWHDLQEAYQNNDAERLEILLALTDLHDGSGERQATLFHLRQLTAEFVRTEKSLRQTLTKLKKTPAGQLASCRDREAFEEKTRSGFNRRLRTALSHLKNLESLVATWTSPGKAAGKKRAKSVKGQGDFDF